MHGLAMASEMSSMTYAVDSSASGSSNEVRRIRQPVHSEISVGRHDVTMQGVRHAQVGNQNKMWIFEQHLHFDVHVHPGSDRVQEVAIRLPDKENLTESVSVRVHLVGVDDEKIEAMEARILQNMSNPGRLSRLYEWVYGLLARSSDYVLKLFKVKRGSIVIVIGSDSPQAIKEFKKKVQDGVLDNELKEMLLTDDVLQLAEGAPVYVKVEVINNATKRKMRVIKNILLSLTGDMKVTAMHPSYKTMLIYACFTLVFGGLLAAVIEHNKTTGATSVTGGLSTINVVVLLNFLLSAALPGADALTLVVTVAGVIVGGLTLAVAGPATSMTVLSVVLFGCSVFCTVKTFHTNVSNTILLKLPLLLIVPLFALTVVVALVATKLAMVPLIEAASTAAVLAVAATTNPFLPIVAEIVLVLLIVLIRIIVKKFWKPTVNNVIANLCLDKKHRLIEYIQRSVEVWYPLDVPNLTTKALSNDKLKMQMVDILKEFFEKELFLEVNTGIETQTGNTIDKLTDMSLWSPVKCKSKAIQYSQGGTSEERSLFIKYE